MRTSAIFCILLCVSAVVLAKHTKGHSTTASSSNNNAVSASNNNNAVSASTTEDTATSHGASSTGGETSSTGGETSSTGMTATSTTGAPTYELVGPLQVLNAKMLGVGGTQDFNFTLSASFDRKASFGVFYLQDIDNPENVCVGSLTQSACTEYTTEFHFQIDDVLGSWSSAFLPCIVMQTSLGFNNSGMYFLNGSPTGVAVSGYFYNPNRVDPTWSYFTFYNAKANPRGYIYYQQCGGSSTGNVPVEGGNAATPVEKLVLPLKH